MANYSTESYLITSILASVAYETSTSLVTSQENTTISAAAAAATTVASSLSNSAADDLFSEPTTLAHEKPDTKDCTFYNFMISTICGGAFCLLGIVGNSLSILVLRKEHNPTGFILLCLAVSDLLLVVSLFVMKGVPALCTYGHLDEFFEVFPYILVYGWPTATIIHTAGTWITVLVTVNRYIAIRFPHRAASLISLHSARMQVSVISLVAVLFTLPNYLDNRLERTWVDALNATVLIRVYTPMGENDLYQALYKTSAYYVMVFALPLLALFVLTILLTRTLRQADRRRALMMAAAARNDAAKREVTVVLIAVVVVFMLCQFLQPLRRVLEAVYDRSELVCGTFYAYYAEINVLLVQINSSVNFFIYCLFGSRFRESLRQLCGRKAKAGRATARPPSIKVAVVAGKELVARMPSVSDTPPTSPGSPSDAPGPLPTGMHSAVGGSTSTLASTLPDDDVIAKVQEESAT